MKIILFFYQNWRRISMEMALKEYVKPIIEVQEMQLSESNIDHIVGDPKYIFENVLLHNRVFSGDFMSEES